MCIKFSASSITLIDLSLFLYQFFQFTLFYLHMVTIHVQMVTGSSTFLLERRMNSAVCTCFGYYLRNMSTNISMQCHVLLAAGHKQSYFVHGLPRPLLHVMPEEGFEEPWTLWTERLPATHRSLRLQILLYTVHNTFVQNIFATSSVCIHLLSKTRGFLLAGTM